MLSMIKKYALEKIRLFVTLIIGTVIFATIFYAEQVPLDTVLYGFLICTFALILYVVVDFYRYRKKLKKLNKIKNDVLNKTDNLPTPTNESDRLYTEIVRNWEELYNKLIFEQTNKNSETSDFYTKWVHQIKTPIFALGLLIKEQPDNQVMLSELSKIEQYTAMVLGYLRLFESDNDLLIKEVSISSIISDVLKGFAPVFLAKRIRPTLEVEDFYIKTDEKHLKFALCQIVSNSAKYSEKSDICITVKNKVLTVSDKGIGIEQSDLPRIFDKGYTGFCGRIEEKSTGLGLYLCKKTLELLGFSISVKSEKGKGTDVLIDLSQDDRLHE